MKRFILSLAMLPLAACAANDASLEPRLSERETREVARVTEGKVAGEPVNCITSFDSSKLRAIGDNLIVYEENKNLVYLNRPAGACNGISSGGTLVMNRTSGSQYCRGDIARVVDLPSGSWAGSCTLGNFIPYRTAGQ